MSDRESVRIEIFGRSIYNLDELASGLGLTLHDRTPEEILLSAYRRWGCGLFAHLDGEFALVIHDHGKGRILAARDPLGLHSLYYLHARDGIRFSDDPEALFRLEGGEKHPDNQAIRDFLHRGAVAYEKTLYRGLGRIPPGHYLQIDNDRHSLHRYWYPEKLPTRHDLSLGDAAEIFSGLLEKALAKRMGTMEETAFELSGGLDSSTLVSLAASKTKGLRSYSMTFQGLACDERSHIKAVENHWQIRSHYVSALPAANPLESIFRLSPHWPATTTFAMYLPMFEQMRKDGIRIVITGQGGDHLLGADGSLFADLLSRREYRRWFRELLRLPLVPFPLSPRSFVPPAFPAKIPPSFRRALTRKRPDATPPFYDPFELDALSSPAKRSAIARLISPVESLLRDGNIFHAAERAFGFEFRHPFFDRELVEFVLTLPPEHLYSVGWNKLLLRYAMAELLPSEILSRRDKAEFSPVIVREIQRIGPMTFMRNFLMERLGFIERREIERLHRDFLDGRHKRLLKYWRLLQTEYWYRQHFEL